MKIKKIIFAIIPFLFLTSCNTKAIEDDINEETFINKLIPNWPTFVAQIIAFIFVITLVIIFAYKPIKKYLKKRADYIENNIKEAETNKNEAIANNKRSEELILASQKQASDIITNAKDTALIEKERIEQETTLAITKMKKDAEKDIELAKKDAVEEINKEIVSVALLASEHVLEREITKEDNEKLAKSFVEEVKKKL